MSPAEQSKPSATRNHYLTLGVDAFADPEDVKKAYRKLARQTHPDSPTGDEEAFKSINEAYGVLSNKAKRVLYDAQLRRVLLDKREPSQASSRQRYQSSQQPQSQEPAKSSAASANSGSTSTKDPPIDTAEGFFERFLKEPLRKGAPKEWPGIGSNIGQTLNQWLKDDDKSPSNSPRGEDVAVEVSLSAKEAMEGTTKTVHIKHREHCVTCHGAGMVNGLSCRVCRGEQFIAHTRKIEVTIPANVKHGAKIRVAGEGGRGPSPASNGDLYLLVAIKGATTNTASTSTASSGQHVADSPTAKNTPPESNKEPAHSPSTASSASTGDGNGNGHQGFHVEGLHVHSDVMVSFWDALLGGSIKVNTMHGGVTLTIPPNTTSGKKLRLKEQGVHNGNERGDHWVRVMVDLPRLNDAQRQRMEEWRPPTA
jgi:DnaJ-class molecular chaperone